MQYAEGRAVKVLMDICDYVCICAWAFSHSFIYTICKLGIDRDFPFSEQTHIHTYIFIYLNIYLIIYRWHNNDTGCSRKAAYRKSLQFDINRNWIYKYPLVPFNFTAHSPLTSMQWSDVFCNHYFFITVNFVYLCFLCFSSVAVFNILNYYWLIC